MADILIRGVPDHVVSAIDARARRVGLSRAKYLRRVLDREQRDGDAEITVDSLQRFRETFCDLEAPDVMQSAWS